jgi:NAD(P)H-quinone oxidoreductase subunit 5
LSGAGDFESLLGSAPWPDARANLPAIQALVVGLLLVIAAAGKSALVPFSGWLPRAMEGPTPSSAVFYGALSVHLGVFLLLRASPLFERSIVLSIVVISLGLSTAMIASLVEAVQTDIKSALSFAALAQVGIIVVEVGVAALAGWIALKAAPQFAQGAAWIATTLRYIALIHLLGHACLRTLQFLRAPTLLHDYHLVENAIGAHLNSPGAPLGRLAGARHEARLYRFAIERGYLDVVLRELIVAPFVRSFGWFDSVERRFTDWLCGQSSRESDDVKPRFETLEEVS